MIIMDINDANQLSAIYNTLMSVKVAGEDCISMGKALNALQTLLSQVKVQETENKEE